MLWSGRPAASSRGRRISASIFAILLGLSVAVVAPAQLSTGTITGTVIDPQGAAIGGVKVLAVETNTNFQARSETNADGLYRIQSLQPGTYDVSFESVGFKGLVQKGLQLKLGDAPAIDGTCNSVRSASRSRSPVPPRFSRPRPRLPAPSRTVRRYTKCLCVSGIC